MVHRPLIDLLYEYQSEVIDQYGAFGGMRIDRENRSTPRKPALVPLFPPHNPQGLTWDRRRVITVSSSGSGASRVRDFYLSVRLSVIRPSLSVAPTWCVGHP